MIYATMEADLINNCSIVVAFFLNTRSHCYNTADWKTRQSMFTSVWPQSAFFPPTSELCWCLWSLILRYQRKNKDNKIFVSIFAYIILQSYSQCWNISFSFFLKKSPTSCCSSCFYVMCNFREVRTPVWTYKVRTSENASTDSCTWVFKNGLTVCSLWTS